MEKTNSETKNATWFRAEIPDYVNDALKSLAREKTQRYRKHGASYTKESVIIAILEIVVDAKKTGSLKYLSSWLYDGEYTGKISETVDAKIDANSSSPDTVPFSKWKGGFQAITLKNKRLKKGVPKIGASFCA